MSELDSRLNDLRKRLLQQSQAETPPIPTRRTGMLTAGQLAPETRVAGEPEPRLYSVRRLLQNISPELEPVEPSAKAGRKAADQAPPEVERSEPEAPVPAVKNSPNTILEPSAERTSSNSFQLFQAVAKVFEQTNGLRDQLAELSAAFEPVEELSKSATSVFGTLKRFQEQVSRLAEAFEPMRSFQMQVAQLAQSFEAMRPLEQQLGHLASGFQIHLDLLVKALEPAKELGARMLKLAQILEPASDLQEEFSRLSDSFEISVLELKSEAKNEG